MSKTWKIVLILVGVVVILAILAMIFGKDGKEVEVQVEEVELRDIIESVSASGKIQPETEVKITSEVSGQIIELPVKEGDVVKKGGLLMRINPDIYNSALNRAGAALNSAKSSLANAKARKAQVEAQFIASELNYNRNKTLHDQGVISEAEWDNISSNFSVAEAEVIAAAESVKSAEYAIMSAQATMTEAADNLKRTSIHAPKDGTVTALTKEVGEGVLGNQMMAGEVIMKISDLSGMEVDVEVNESDIVNVSLGDTAIVEVDAYQDVKFKGIVTEIGNTALNSLQGMSMSMDQVTNFSVKINILKSSYENLMEDKPASFSPFRPGMSATVDIETERVNNVVSISIKAVTSRKDTTSTSKYSQALKKNDEELEPITLVFRYDEESEKSRIAPIVTGIQDTKYIEIRSGLSEGQKIITGPYEEVSRKLTANKKVTIDSGKKDESEEE